MLIQKKMGIELQGKNVDKNWKIIKISLKKYRILARRRRF